MKGARVVREEVLRKVASDRVEVFFVWMPVVPGDARRQAEGHALKMSDPLARHFWDGTCRLGGMYAPVLGPPAERLAWDVYLVFDADAEWGDSVPVPCEWMHQLTVIPDPRRLDGKRLREAVEGRLENR